DHAIHLCREVKPDCVLVDEEPAEAPARETVKRFSNAFPLLPCAIVVATERFDRDAARELLQMGVQDCLQRDATVLARLLRALTFAVERFERIKEVSSTSEEQALRRSGETFRATLSDAAVGLLIRDLDEPGLKANRAFCEMTGWTPQQLAAMTIEEIVHPDDRTTVGHIRVSDADSTVGEMRYLSADGSSIWARTSVRRVRDSDGRPRQFVAAVENISDRKLAEEAVRENADRFEQLARSIHEIFWFYSVEPYRCLYVSPAFERI